MRIQEVLDAKPLHTVVTVPPEATVRELVALLAEHNVGALVVSRDGSSVDGIVSERDVVRQLLRDDRVLDASVESVMTAVVATCVPGDRIEDLMAVMTERRIRHVPVVADDALVGIVSIGDVVKHTISSLQFERDQLDGYLHQS